MKKKILILSLFLALAFTFSACSKKNEISSDDSKKEQYSTLKDWLESGKGVQCEVETPKGKITVKTKNDKVRMDGVPWMDMENLGEGDVSSGSSISDGDWVYMWSGEKGMKMNLKEMSEMEVEDSDDFDEGDYSWEDWAEDQDNMNTSYACQESKISDDIFIAPSGVEFTDWSEMMKGFMNMGQNMMDTDNLPNVEGSQSMTQEELEAQIEKMMKGSNLTQ